MTLLGLLVATAAAFAITERLKLVKSPVYGTLVSTWISPGCNCVNRKAAVSVKLRHADTVTVTIVDGRRHLVRTLAAGEFVPRGRAVFTWDGRNDLGGRMPDGVYRAEVHLARQHRTILLPNPITLDTQPPKVLAASATRRTISPDGDHVHDSTAIRYELDSPGHALVFLGTQLLIRSRSLATKGAVRWYGIVDDAPLKAGTYRLLVGAVDPAGNVTRPSARKLVVIRIRYVELSPRTVVVGRPAVRFGIRVDTDAARYRWTLAGRSGVSTRRVLVLRAPKKAGAYGLVVGEHGHTARAVIVVRSGR